MSYSFDFWLQMKFISRLSLEKKREVVCALNGMPDPEVLSRWMGKDKIVILKPQYIHSAAAILILYTFPEFRCNKEPSWYDMLIRHKVEQEAYQVATDVLNADEDGQYFLTRQLNEFGQKCIMMDDHNQATFTRNQDGVSISIEKNKTSVNK